MAKKQKYTGSVKSKIVGNLQYAGKTYFAYIFIITENMVFNLIDMN
ncbi:hypothetical protein HNR32_002455 [Pectinatus brassicae]|uniref:Uncharacterized protein n=1 Tax=Pectinatus brassicae TaxID=862415 RepID=A0A840UY38_9FIRM|nr:hypothetical protein [Pectinatus brassicae]